MEEFEVPVEFTFKCKFKVKTNDLTEAMQNVTNHCGLVFGRGIHTTLPPEDIDWELDMTPEKKIIGIKQYT